MSVKQILVAPFKIKSITECLSHFAVLENAFAGVEGKSLHAPWKFMGNFITDDEILIEGFPGVGGCPQFGIVLLAEIVLTGLECFQGNGGIPVIIVTHLIEIVHPEMNGKFFGPVVFYPFVNDVFSSLKFFDFVSSTAQGRFKTRFAEITSFPVVLR